MNKPPTAIIKSVFSALPPSVREHLSLKKSNSPGGNDDVAEMKFMGEVQSFQIIYEPAISHIMIPFLQAKVENIGKEYKMPVLLLSKVVYPEVGKALDVAGINYIDSFGNVFIKGTHFFIHSTGHRAPRPKVGKKNRAFQEAGIKLIFGLLNHPDFIQLPYREMAAAIGISLGSVNIILSELLAAEYLEERSGGSKKIIRRDDLLQRWATAYQEVLRPNITLGNYTFWNKDLLKEYEHIPISGWGGLWGGEAGGGIYTRYLVPEKLTQFVHPDAPRTWLNAMKLIPSEEEGDIELFQFFWDTEHPLFKATMKYQNVVPPLLVYADLATSMDIRNRETAQKIYDEYIQSR